MTKAEFIGLIDSFHKQNNETRSRNFLMDVTRMSERLCKDVIRSIWGCSNPKYVGLNLYNLIKNSAEDQEFVPKLRKGCHVYFMYLDEHTAIFALHKIKEYKDLDRWKTN